MAGRPTWILCPTCGTNNAKPHCRNIQCLFYFCDVCEHQHLIQKRGFKWVVKNSVRMAGKS